MKLIKYVSLFLVAGVASSLLYLWGSTPALSQSTVQLQTTPPLQQVIPASTPVQLRFQAVDINQQLLKNATFQVSLQTPAKTPWLSSDFPIVEGTTLLELKTQAPAGTLQFEQVLPIRGVYQARVSVTPENTEFEPFEQVLSFSVAENPVKYRNVAILAVILLLAGSLSGWMLGGNQVPGVGEIAPQPVRMLLSAATILAIIALLVVNISAEFADSHTHHHHHHSDSAFAPAVTQSQGLQVQLSGETHTKVGETATQTVEITDSAGKPVRDVQLNIEAVGLEHNQRIFQLTGQPDQAGKFTWQQQFFDGAPHQINVTVSSISNNSRQFLPLQVSHEIEVEGVAPPLYIRFITLCYFTAIFALSLIAGLLLRRRLPPRKIRSSLG